MNGARKPCFALIYFNFKIWGLSIKKKEIKNLHTNFIKKKKYLRTQVKCATPIEYMKTCFGYEIWIN